MSKHRQKRPIYLRLSERVKKIVSQLSHAFAMSGGNGIPPVLRVKKAQIMLKRASRVEGFLRGVMEKQPAVAEFLQQSLVALAGAMQKVEERIELFRGNNQDVKAYLELENKKAQKSRNRREEHPHADGRKLAR